MARYVQATKEGGSVEFTPAGVITTLSDANYYEAPADQFFGTGGFTAGALVRTDFRNGTGTIRSIMCCASDYNEGWMIFQEGDTWKARCGKSGPSNTTVTYAAMPQANMPPLYMKTALVVLRMAADGVMTIYVQGNAADPSVALTYVGPDAGTKMRFGNFDGDAEGFTHGGVLGGFFTSSVLTDAQVREITAKCSLIGDMADAETFTLTNLWRASSGAQGAPSTWTPVNGSHNLTKVGSPTYEYARITML